MSWDSKSQGLKDHGALSRASGVVSVTIRAFERKGFVATDLAVGLRVGAAAANALDVEFAFVLSVSQLLAVETLDRSAVRLHWVVAEAKSKAFLDEGAVIVGTDHLGADVRGRRIVVLAVAANRVLDSAGLERSRHRLVVDVETGWEAHDEDRESCVGRARRRADATLEGITVPLLRQDVVSGLVIGS